MSFNPGQQAAQQASMAAARAAQQASMQAMQSAQRASQQAIGSQQDFASRRHQNYQVRPRGSFIGRFIVTILKLAFTAVVMAIFIAIFIAMVSSMPR